MYNFDHFLEAQKSSFTSVLAELSAGQKKSHWMWFIFPQIEGLGHSDLAKRFALHSCDEARAFLQHDILGPRLRTCTSLTNQIKRKIIHEIFGTPDDLKFRSCMTLFASVERDSIFTSALDKYFDGSPDPLTLEIIASR